MGHQEIWLSPNYSLDESRSVVKKWAEGKLVETVPCRLGNKLTFTNKNLALEILEDRVEGWFFKPAINLIRQNNEVAAVYLVTPLIEALEQRYRGQSSQGQEGNFFKDRASKIFPELDPQQVILLYKGVRCGFAHSGFFSDDNETYNILIYKNDLEDLDTGNSERLDAMKYMSEDQVLYIEAFRYVLNIWNAYVQFAHLCSTDHAIGKRFLCMWQRDWQMSWSIPSGGGTVGILPP